jgi:hypothetical protein
VACEPIQIAEELADAFARIDAEGLSMTEAEQEKAKDVFVTYAVTNEKDEQIMDTSELSELLMTLGQACGKPELEVMVAQADSKGAGSLDLCEFLVLYARVLDRQNGTAFDGNAQAMDDLSEYGVFALMRWAEQLAICGAGAVQMDL